MTTRWNNCAHCGIWRRMVNPVAGCIDCRRALRAGRTPTEEHELTGGTWQNVRGIQRWVRDEAPEPVAVKRGPKPTPDFFEWDWPELIEARRQHGTGERTAWAIEGNRVYKRETKRRQRATKNEQKEAA